MLRISKLADYAVVICTHLAGQVPAGLSSVRTIARRTGVPEPTARKLLKQLAGGGLLRSQRGARGGYLLARPAEDITLGELLEAVEGAPGLTECTRASGDCPQEGRCAVQPHWQHINRALAEALAGVTLADLTRPALIPLTLATAATPERAKA